MNEQRRPKDTTTTTDQLDYWLQDYKRLGERSKRERHERQAERTGQQPQEKVNQVRDQLERRATQ